MSDCCLGFEDLVWVTRGRGWTEAERLAFVALDQDGRNAWVRARAAAAGDLIEIEDRVGADGVLYTAFTLRRPAWFDRLEWSRPVPRSDLTAAGLPDAAGCLVVSVDAGPLVPGKVREVVAAARLAEGLDRLAGDEPRSGVAEDSGGNAHGGFVRWVITDHAQGCAGELERHLLVRA